jgi:hypothetical protein
VQEETRRLRDEFGPELLVLSGGHRGVDLWAPRAPRELALRLRLYLPAPAPLLAADWSTDWADALASAEAHAEQVVIFGPSARDSWGYAARNRALARDGDLLIAVWTGQQPGGTADTLTIARRLARPVREHLLARSSHQPAPGERGV